MRVASLVQRRQYSHHWSECGPKHFQRHQGPWPDVLPQVEEIRVAELQHHGQVHLGGARLRRGCFNGEWLDGVAVQRSRQPGHRNFVDPGFASPQNLDGHLGLGLAVDGGNHGRVGVQDALYHVAVAYRRVQRGEQRGAGHVQDFCDRGFIGPGVHLLGEGQVALAGPQTKCREILSKKVSGVQYPVRAVKGRLAGQNGWQEVYELL